MNGIIFLSWDLDFIVTDFIVTPLFFSTVFFLILFWHQKSGWTTDSIEPCGVAREMLDSDFMLNYR